MAMIGNIGVAVQCSNGIRSLGQNSHSGRDAVAFEMTGMVGAEFPLFAFSHCRDVVAAVSRAGGFGVLGGARFSPESLEQELKWIDDHVDGKPYGIDILIPEHQAVKAGTSVEA